MRKIQILGLALFGVFALTAFVTSSAFALESVWLVNGNVITSEVPVDSTLSAGTMLFEDMKEKIDITCTTVTDKGFVGGLTVNNVFDPKLDLVTEATITGCSSPSCSSATITAENLPWLTELLLVGGIFLDDLVSDGNGAPSYLAVCTVLGIKVEDLCGTELASVDIDNTTESDVVALFNEEVTEPTWANCSRGGNLTGLVVGAQLILTVSGLPLAVSEG